MSKAEKAHFGWPMMQSFFMRTTKTLTSLCGCTITKTCPYYFDPLKPYIYIVKLGFTGVYIIFLISPQNIDWGYLLELPHGGSSNEYPQSVEAVRRLWYSLGLPQRGVSYEYPQSMFWAEVWKISKFLSENFHFLMVKFSVYLNRRVFVMHSDLCLCRVHVIRYVYSLCGSNKILFKRAGYTW